MRQRMHRRRLVLARNHHARAAMLLKIGGDCVNRLSNLSLRLRPVPHPESTRKASRQPLDFYRTNGQPMIRLCSGRGGITLDDVETAHIAIGIPALCEIANVADIARKSGIQEISVERH